MAREMNIRAKELAPGDMIFMQGILPTFVIDIECNGLFTYILYLNDSNLSYVKLLAESPIDIQRLAE